MDFYDGKTDKYVRFQIAEEVVTGGFISGDDGERCSTVVNLGQERLESDSIGAAAASLGLSAIDSATFLRPHAIGGYSRSVDCGATKPTREREREEIIILTVVHATTTAAARTTVMADVPGKETDNN